MSEGKAKKLESPGGNESTDEQSRFDQSDKMSEVFGARHNFDWSSVAYLFDKGEIPDEIAAITDPVEYNYLMVRLRKEFNDKHKSNYLKYMALNLPYHSRRDEVGGAISENDWSHFVTRLEGIIEKAPGLNFIFGTTKDMTEAFVGENKKFTRPVVVEISDGVYKIGFLTQEDMSAVGLPNCCAVYLPYSYTLSGETTVVEKSRVRRIDKESGDVTKFVLSGGATNLK